MCSRGHLEAAAAGLKEDVRPRPPAPQPRAAPGTGTVLEPGAGPARPPGCSRLSLPDTPPPKLPSPSSPAATAPSARGSCRAGPARGGTCGRSSGRLPQGRQREAGAGEGASEDEAISLSGLIKHRMQVSLSPPPTESHEDVGPPAPREPGAPVTRASDCRLQTPRTGRRARRGGPPLRCARVSADGAHGRRRPLYAVLMNNRLG